MMMKMRFKVTYDIEEDQIEDFKNAIKPYIGNLSKVFEGSNRIRKSIHNKVIKEVLSTNGELSAMEIYRKYRYASFGYKTLTRRLAELIVIGEVTCRKIECEKGGYKNLYKLL